MDSEEIQKILEEARKFLRENTSQDEPNYYVNHNGDLIPLPPDMEYDYERDYIRFKKR